eukprot:6214313-Pleurochrysis_carterae.AAC.4
MLRRPQPRAILGREEWRVAAAACQTCAHWPRHASHPRAPSLAHGVVDAERFDACRPHPPPVAHGRRNRLVPRLRDCDRDDVHQHPSRLPVARR